MPNKVYLFWLGIENEKMKKKTLFYYTYFAFFLSPPDLGSNDEGLEMLSLLFAHDFLT